jgi:hypothetical protein
MLNILFVTFESEFGLKDAPGGQPAHFGRLADVGPFKANRPATPKKL